MKGNVEEPRADTEAEVANREGVAKAVTDATRS